MDKKQLRQILDLHGAWLKGDPSGQKADLHRANLCEANLCGANLFGANLIRADLRRANLRGADLCGANLFGANLCEANLIRANLCEANLREADLRRANLRGAHLFEANLRGANLCEANLRGANLRGADLYGADLREADLSWADLPNFQLVPEIGQFYGFKKLQDETIATLLIPKSALRTSSLVGRKCRASKVKVVSLSGGATKAFDKHTGTLKYEVGKWIKPDKYDPDIRVECTNGIHFFITKKEAEEY